MAPITAGTKMSDLYHHAVGAWQHLHAIKKMKAMHRKHFLLNSIGVGAALALGTRAQAMPAAADATSFVVAAGKSRFGNSPAFMGLHPNDLKVAGSDTNGQLAMFDYTGHAIMGPPLHVHYHQDEVFTVIEGRYRFVVGSQQHELQPGDTIFLPRGIPHTWLQLTPKGRLIYLLQPAGQMEEFFKAMSQLQGPPDPAEAQRIHEAHGMKIVGPPLSL